MQLATINICYVKIFPHQPNKKSMRNDMITLKGLYLGDNQFLQEGRDKVSLVSFWRNLNDEQYIGKVIYITGIDDVRGLVVKEVVEHK